MHFIRKTGFFSLKSISYTSHYERDDNFFKKNLLSYFYIVQLEVSSDCLVVYEIPSYIHKIFVLNYKDSKMFLTFYVE